MKSRSKIHWKSPRFVMRTIAASASVLVVAAICLGVGATAPTLPTLLTATSPTVSLWPTTSPPAGDAAQSDAASVTLGVKFTSSGAGSVSGIRFYKGTGNTGTHVGDLWSSSGQKLAEATFSGEAATGWQQVLFAAPVTVAANTTYVASYHAPAGHYAETERYFQSSGFTNGPLTALSTSTASGNGVYIYGANAFPRSTYLADNYWVDVLFTAGGTPPTTTTSTSGKPTTTTATTVRPTTTTVQSTGSFPSATNTGVPSGTKLTAYTGPSTITSCGTVIDSKIISGGITIRASNGTRSSATPCVTIKNSLVNGLVNDGYAAQGYGPLLLTDDELNGGQQIVNNSTLYEANWYAWRINVHGGRSGTQCDGFCELHDSYVHDFYFQDSVHYDAFITNGAYGNPILLDHNTLLCSFTNGQTGNGGCSADIGLFADYSKISNVTVTRNLVKANPNVEYYCAYTGTAELSKPYPYGSNVVWTNNTFERGSNGKCGGAGPTYDWQGGNGNVWSGNTWDNGTPFNQ